jgi:SOS-response transcriptional repressor LexA
LTAYPSLRAAAGAAGEPVEGEPEPTTLALPTRAKGKGLFAVRATGDSMNGYQRPIRDGDWVIMRATPGATCADLDGKVALCRIPDATGGQSFQIKRVVRQGERFALRSDNPSARPRSYEVNEETRLLAVRVDVVRREDEEASPASSGGVP